MAAVGRDHQLRGLGAVAASAKRPHDRAVVRGRQGEGIRSTELELVLGIGPDRRSGRGARRRATQVGLGRILTHLPMTPTASTMSNARKPASSSTFARVVTR